MSDIYVDDPVHPTRSRIMRAIRGKDTKPEMMVRRLAHSMGYRFRLHAKDLPGKPDLVFRSRRKAIFVHGCFWHRHGCRKSSVPATRTEWWTRKLDSNVERDRRSATRLAEMGWESMTIWECETGDEDYLRRMMGRFLSPPGSRPRQSLSPGESPLGVDAPPPYVGFEAPREADDNKAASKQERGSTMASKQKSSKPPKSSAPAADAASSASPSGIESAAAAPPARPKAASNAATKTSTPERAAAKTADGGGTKTSRSPAKKSTAGKSPAKAASKSPATKSQPRAAAGTQAQQSPQESAPAGSPSAERPLPDRYTAATNPDAETVTISRRGGQGPSVTVRMQSFGSVTSVLGMLEDGSHGVLDSNAQLEIVDTFSGKKAAVTAEALSDVAAVLTALAQGGQGTQAPAQSAAAPARAAPQAKAAAPKAAAKKQPAPAKAGTKAPPAKAPSAQAGKGKPAAKTAASKGDARSGQAQSMPGWFSSGFENEYTSADANYRLERTELAVDPTNAKRVSGRWGSAEGNHAWGYEVLSGDRHVAWVIAEDERTFLLTGAPDYQPSVHRNIVGLMARITAAVMPRFSKAA